MSALQPASEQDSYSNVLIDQRDPNFMQETLTGLDHDHPAYPALYARFKMQGRPTTPRENDLDSRVQHFVDFVNWPLEYVLHRVHPSEPTPKDILHLLIAQRWRFHVTREEMERISELISVSSEGKDVMEGVMKQLEENEKYWPIVVDSTLQSIVGSTHENFLAQWEQFPGLAPAPEIALQIAGKVLRDSGRSVDTVEIPVILRHAEHSVAQLIGKYNSAPEVKSAAISEITDFLIDIAPRLGMKSVKNLHNSIMRTADLMHTYGIDKKLFKHTPFIPLAISIGAAYEHTAVQEERERLVNMLKLLASRANV